MWYFTSAMTTPFHRLSRINSVWYVPTRVWQQWRAWTVTLSEKCRTRVKDNVTHPSTANVRWRCMLVQVSCSQASRSSSVFACQHKYAMMSIRWWSSSFRGQALWANSNVSGLNTNRKCLIMVTRLVKSAGAIWLDWQPPTNNHFFSEKSIGRNRKVKNQPSHSRPSLITQSGKYQRGRHWLAQTRFFVPGKGGRRKAWRWSYHVTWYKE